MAAAGSDLLDDLPDDLLRHVLRFAPSKDAASTAVLSRRWRSLWPSPWGAGGAAVILDSRSYDRAYDGDYFGKRNAFFRGAEAALAAHGASGVRSLAVHVEARDPESFMFNTGGWSGWPDLAADVLSHPACRRVEELRIAADTADYPIAGYEYEWLQPHRRYGHYKLDVGAVPSEALRVLHIAGCRDLTPPPPGATFRCLEALRLRRCAVSLDSLQDMIIASPQLATLHLEYVFFTTMVDDHRNQKRYYEYNDEVDEGSSTDSIDGLFFPKVTLTPADGLCFPEVTTLVLVNCCHKEDIDIALDVPRVRHFRYRGNIHRFLLNCPLPDVQLADLHFVDTDSDQDEFWNYVKKFRNSKILRLKMNFPLEDIAVTDKKGLEELLGGTLFGNLDRLEIDGQGKPASKDTAVAIGNLLYSCPVVRDLRLKLNIVDKPYRRRRSRWSGPTSQCKRDFLHKKAQADFYKSVDHFTRSRNPVIHFGGCGNKYDVPDLPGLSENQFSCLQCYLRRVSLQFLMEKPNGLCAQLAKFFVDNATALQEFYIDDGNQKVCEHMNRKVDGWASSSLKPCSESRGTPREFCNNKSNSPSSARSVTVLPLDR
ncbi:hypothetical protein ACP70R_007810 [Stipagrostis hirtigluma subsp. patula]